MKYFKWFVYSFLIIASCFSCSSEKDTRKVIAIVNLMNHPSLDAVQENTLKVLAENGIEDGKEYRILVKNANGQITLIPAIVNEVLAKNPVLVIPISTPVTQAFVKRAKCPIVFGIVTDPVGAGIVKSLSETTHNITGTSDILPYEEQIAMIRTIHPNFQKMGIIYNPGEAASQFGVKKTEEFAPKYNFQLVQKTVSSTVEVFSAAKSIIDEVDVIYISSDNTVVSGIASIVKMAIEKQKPLYVGDGGTVAKGGIAALSKGYDGLGKETGKLAIKVLNGEKNLPILYETKSELYVNAAAAELMGVTLSDSLVNSAVKIYDTIAN